MVFSSASFIFIFLPVVFLLYSLILGLRGKNVLLTIASLLFYAYGEPVFVLVMLASVAANYVFARLIAGGADGTSSGSVISSKAAAGAEKEEQKCGHSANQKLVLAVSVIFNLALIGVFKYAGFFVQTVNDVTGAGLHVPEIALPIGISFFTFQALSYVIDVYRDPATVQKNFGKVLLYISFFPQLIAGPIVKYHDIAPYLDERSADIDEIAAGINRFVTGLAKKMFLANAMGAVADQMFNLPGSGMSAGTAWIGAICYTMQIFFDFSGYSDMAIGIGHMFGFTIKENFDHPYISTSIKEFWRRWHISLSTWFKEYLYIPLGGSRVSTAKTEMNKLIVFFATGLWHGASWTFVVWGMIHGISIVIEDLIGRTTGRKKENKKKSLPLCVIGWLYTMLIVILAFVLFRADTLAGGLVMIREMFTGFPGTLASYNTCMEVLNPYNIVIFAAACFCSAPHPKLKERLREHGAVSYVITMVLFILCILEIAGASFNPFIYFRF